MQDQGTCGDVLPRHWEYTRRVPTIYCELVDIGSSCLWGQGRVCVGYVLGGDAGEGKGERSRISVMVFERVWIGYI